MRFYVRFLIVWLVNSFVLWFARLYWGSSIVLGNAVLTPMAAAFLTGFLLTVLMKASKPLLMALKFGVKGRMKMFATYFVFNFLFIWLLARLAPITGFGIAAYYWALILAFFTCLFQWLTRQVLKTLKLIETK